MSLLSYFFYFGTNSPARTVDDKLIDAFLASLLSSVHKLTGYVVSLYFSVGLRSFFLEAYYISYI
jgi:hypothetical protein